jgi:hypothetical protein
MASLVVAGCLGLILGLGVDPIVGALVDASQSLPPTKPGALPATATTRLREFQSGVGDSARAIVSMRPPPSALYRIRRDSRALARSR